ncbi:predicted protein [Uncinocarpus reesii 1704]|uniref:F-box domain-containing protein n=1 Tax=Uncinocarpus reesii (strain UAMH 1704) TaxID=336963 RepID=C4JNJ4_UNCRE|nr:uncharacterized protein UREG_02992 [Uncinocarpus reesii 1704]EEP78147.1 predicted protein [Uncinocarpus reesii 1704]
MYAFLTPPVPSLSALPPELLLHIIPYLPPDAQLALSLTTKRLYHILADQVPKWSEITSSEQYPFLYLLEKLKLSTPSNSNTPVACCSGCSLTHLRYNFVDEELAKSADRRVCREATKSFWLNADTQYSFNDLTTHRDADRGWVSEDGHLRRNSTLSFTIFTTYKILSLPKSTQASRKKIASILHTFDLPSCPHTRLSNPLVLEGYVPNAHPVDAQPLYDTHNAAGKCRFPACKTHFYWITRTHASKPDWKTLYLEIQRDIGRLVNPDAPAWLAQLIAPNTDNLTKFWNDRMQWKRQMLVYEERKYEQEQLQQQQPRLSISSSPSPMTYIKSTLATLPSPQPAPNHSVDTNEGRREEHAPTRPEPVDDETQLFTAIWGAGIPAAHAEFRRKYKRANRAKLWQDTVVQCVGSILTVVGPR